MSQLYQISFEDKISLLQDFLEHLYNYEPVSPDFLNPRLSFRSWITVFLLKILSQRLEKFSWTVTSTPGAAMLVKFTFSDQVVSFEISPNNYSSIPIEINKLRSQDVLES